MRVVIWGRANVLAVALPLACAMGTVACGETGENARSHDTGVFDAGTDATSGDATAEAGTDHDAAFVGSVLATANARSWIIDPDPRPASVLAVYTDGTVVEHDVDDGVYAGVSRGLEGAALDQLWAVGDGSGTRAWVGLAEGGIDPGTTIDLSFVEYGGSPTIVQGRFDVPDDGEWRILEGWPGEHRYDRSSTEFGGVVPEGVGSMQLRAFRFEDQQFVRADGVDQLSRRFSHVAVVEVDLRATGDPIVVTGASDFELPEFETVDFTWELSDGHDLTSGVLAYPAHPSAGGAPRVTGAWTFVATDQRMQRVRANVYPFPVIDAAPPVEMLAIAAGPEVVRAAFLESEGQRRVARFPEAPVVDMSAGSLRGGRAIHAELPTDPEVELRIRLRSGQQSVASVTLRGTTFEGIPQAVFDAVPSLREVDRAVAEVCEPHLVHPAACSRMNLEVDETDLEGPTPR